jgi:hypothetical protein
MTSSSKRALAVVAILALAAVGVGYYFLRGHSSPPIVAPGGPPPDLLSLLPPGAPVIAFGDVAALRASEFAADLTSFGPPPDQEEDYRAFVRETGFDYSRDLDKFAIDAWPDVAEAQPNAPPRVALIVLAEGRFDRAKISAYARRMGSVTRHGDADVFEIPSSVPGQKFSLAFLSDNRIALAQETSIDPVLAATTSGRLDAATRERVAPVSGATVFAVAKTDNLPKLLANAQFQSGQLNRLLKSIRGISLAGHPDGHKLTIAVEADCDSLSNALQLAATLDALRWIGRAALADPKNRAQMTPQDAANLDTLLRVATVSRENHILRIRLELTPDMLRTVSAPPAPPSKPAPKKIAARP